MVADMYDFQRMKYVMHNDFGMIEITFIPKYLYKLENMNYLFSDLHCVGRHFELYIRACDCHKTTELPFSFSPFTLVLLSSLQLPYKEIRVLYITYLVVWTCIFYQPPQWIFRMPSTEITPTAFFVLCLSPDTKSIF